VQKARRRDASDSRSSLRLQCRWRVIFRDNPTYLHIHPYIGLRLLITIRIFIYRSLYFTYTLLVRIAIQIFAKTPLVLVGPCSRGLVRPLRGYCLVEAPTLVAPAAATCLTDQGLEFLDYGFIPSPPLIPPSSSTP
jgi:hypothetical protein